jgi:hypothetical protein
MGIKRRLPVILQESGAVMDDKSAIAVDPLGSYTGLAENKWEQPVQDADDL